MRVNVKCMDLNYFVNRVSEGSEVVNFCKKFNVEIK